jgi:hypothetical protein
MSEQYSRNSWNDLPHIDLVQEVGESDYAIMREIRDVLLRHNALGRFGISLLHKHFEMRDDEVLIESCDEGSRCLTIRPANQTEIADARSIQTLWQLGDVGDAVLAKCKLMCYKDEDRIHSRVHWP